MSDSPTGRAPGLREIPLVAGTEVVLALVPGRHPAGPRG
jgi:hypothetical protein